MALVWGHSGTRVFRKSQMGKNASAMFKAERETVKRMAELEGFNFSAGEMSFAAGGAADIVAKLVRAMAPRGPTGRLKKSIYAMVIGKGKALIGAKYGKGNAPHAHLVEYGTQERVPGVSSEKYRQTLRYLRSRGLGGRDPDKRSHVAYVKRYGRIITVKSMGKMPASRFFKRALASTRAIVNRFLLDDFRRRMEYKLSGGKRSA